MRPYLIGITGGSGSGKTTFLHKLVEGFGPKEVCVVSQDNYYFPRELQKQDEQGIHNFDLPTSIDEDSFSRDIDILVSGKKVEREEYTYNNKLAKPKLLVFEPAPVIIVEGIFVFHYAKVAKQLDLKLFLHARESISLSRRIVRDQVERNYPLDDVLYRYQNHVMPTFDRFIRPYMDEADIIVNNHEGFDKALDMLRGYIAGKVKGFPQI